MTRRTDWGEYAYPHAPDGRGRGGTGEGTGAVTADGHGRGPYGGPPPYGTDGPRDGEPYDDRPHDDQPYDDRPYDDRFFDRGGRGGGDAGPWADDSRSGAASAGGTRRRDGGDSRGTRGRRGGRGERRRGFGESGDGPDGGGPQDGGLSFSSRAEKDESSGDPAERARAICLRLLTGTPRTRKQLADALRKREIPEDVADAVLSRFEEVGLINDGAFAEAWVESRHHGRGLARRALARELRTKGVDSALIDEAVSQLDSEQEETTARELVARKLRSTRGLDRDRRLRRLAGMLARKGYSEGLALRVVRQALEEEGEDTEGLEGEGF
ncbi:recombination regulator RecX [Streptomyces scabiei]|uniref:recombination regulator RecX n=1 Tax=Streptomyces scabiei TaxID=1930 RepID=UPI00298FD6D0|nr:recombination regulator RecX [Streptomyces scabiei]MDW8807228.1 recombination regulator RecX [Streptomyces scabiei]